ncbi:ABC transporter permease [Fimbriimonas ginsengisoli]|uniref:Transport permease protein n=1 Tax=Fimbriimonas ginsengisoli Gsoil 348 TaxID=661478 RepID=A0A068NW34_FIMGI|nr:ABC transporter permease [Fimbriimonas ginsengisoli]AIE87743.1 Polysaccharide ABC transporter, permease component [Fimbriimonas ginsengisoli Gsoil 348]
MLDELRELWKFRELLLVMVQRDLKIRYKNSALGFFWSLLNPIITVIVMTFVIKNFMYSGAPSISAYILAAYLPFTFFQLSVMDSAQSVLGAMLLIKKIYFPREILPLASVISNVIHFALGQLVFFAYLLVVYLVFPGMWPFQIGTLYLPLLMLITFCLALGCAFYVSALNTFFEDVKYIVGVLLYLLFFLCPVMYFTEKVANSEINRHFMGGGVIYRLLNLNPLTALITAYRKTLLAPPTVDMLGPKGDVAPFLPLNWKYVWLAAAVSVFVLVTGYATFNRLKWKFVERP